MTAVWDRNLKMRKCGKSHLYVSGIGCNELLPDDEDRGQMDSFSSDSVTAGKV